MVWFFLVLKMNKSIWEGWGVLPTDKKWLNSTIIQGDLADQYGLKKKHKSLSQCGLPVKKGKRKSPSMGW